jgi:hypothetical protein
MNDMTGVIIPKSDQINADDLLSGPITITITGVKVAPGQEQPVSITFDGSDKVYRPCKSMARVLVAAWGPDASKYTGRSLTLYCDPKVKWGGMEVGGIRISHMSHIESPMTMALTVTRANKKPFTVKPLVAVAAKAPKSVGGGFDAIETKAADPTLDEQQALQLLALLTEGGRDLTDDFKQFGGLENVTDLPARLFGNAKTWVTRQRLTEHEATQA